MKSLISFVFCIVVSIQIYSQNSISNDIHPLSGTFGVTFEAGATYTFSDFKKDGANIHGRILLEYFFPSNRLGMIGLRGFGGAGYLTGSGGTTGSRPELEEFKTQFAILGAGAEYLFTYSKFIVPYLYGGVGLLYFDPKDNTGNKLIRNASNSYARTELAINGEIGIRFLVSKIVSLNIGANINNVQSDNLDDVPAGTDNDFFLAGFAGISFYFGGNKDSDHDGINDDQDACPETPIGVTVDEFGCPVDADKDGVPDFMDKCPDTPNNIAVDKYGCPIDTDMDGVPDYLDLCSNTPHKIIVDKKGCPVDTDNDGIPDYKDNCPGTPAGTEIDEFGCPVKKEIEKLPEETSFELSGSVNFEIAKSDLLPGAKNELDKIVAVMIEHPETRWLIKGHTDNTGSYSFNKKLSYERASSVANYLNYSGIKSNRLIVRGVGPDEPIADNSTESGRTINRRVTIELIGKNVQTTSRYSPSNYNTQIERNVGQMIFTDGKLFCFQVAAFRTRERAETETARLLDAGENAFVVESYLSELQTTWYRVRIGYFKTLSEAREYRKRFMR